MMYAVCVSQATRVLTNLFSVCASGVTHPSTHSFILLRFSSVIDELRQTGEFQGQAVYGTLRKGFGFALNEVKDTWRVLSWCYDPAIFKIV
jgi:hypothetical protein